jgi:hypothetical protein
MAGALSVEAGEARIWESLVSSSSVGLVDAAK